MINKGKRCEPQITPSISHAPGVVARVEVGGTVRAVVGGGSGSVDLPAGQVLVLWPGVPSWIGGCHKHSCSWHRGPCSVVLAGCTIVASTVLVGGAVLGAAGEDDILLAVGRSSDR